MSENYIVINGKRAELTKGQLEALGIETKKATPFERAKKGNIFYGISDLGGIYSWHEHGGVLQDDLFNVANYCTDKELMQQRALSETLNRLLWRYSMEHDGDKIILNHCWGLKCDMLNNGDIICEAYELWGHILGECVFYSKAIAQSAIKEIVKPFMKQHPEFIW